MKLLVRAIKCFTSEIHGHTSLTIGVGSGVIFIYLFSAQLISFGRNEQNKPDTGGISLSEYRLVRKRLFIKVDFPRPDSPEK